jgi:putative ABC transport system substrate-binding protein
LAGVTFQREAFLQGLSELGYVEGKNITIEYRSAEGKYDQLPDLAAELVRLKVDVILTQSTPAAVAAKNATTTIPIVMAGGSDPVATGLVASLARPGGNITGITIMNAETAGRRLALLKETSAKVSRVAILWNSTNPGAAVVFKQTQTAAQDLGLQLQSLDVQSANALEGAFKGATRGGANALVLLASVPVSNHLRQVADFAVRNRLASIYDRSDFVDAGGLMSYGTHLPEMFRRALIYVDKILKGAKPADLPVEQPMKFELVINLKTAKQIGLTIPQSVLYRADKVIR